ncbi:hypothetical protein QQP08_019676 [Theobroma cacao]|nr:hypothetical protein QQP08_019676 [Theobroma cacao]
MIDILIMFVAKSIVHKYHFEASTLQLINEERCKQACKENESCKAAFFVSMKQLRKDIVFCIPIFSQ